MNLHNVNDELFLKEQYALVCGASSGIGAAISIEFAKRGAHVILLARSSDKLKKIRAVMPTGNHHILVSDLFNFQETVSALDQLIKAKSIGPISILVNNSGGPPPKSPIYTIPPEEFKTALSSHLFASISLTNYLIPAMIENNYGRIINILSTSVKAPLSNLGVSNTVRAAVSNWAKTLATEVANYGITVNSILPGATATPRLQAILEDLAKKNQISLEEQTAQYCSQIPCGKIAKPEEVAHACSFLAAPLSRSITGTALTIDGGRSPSI